MKKGQVISLLLGAAAFAIGAAAYSIAKDSEDDTPAKHDAHDEIVNTPYRPEDDEPEEVPEEAVPDEEFAEYEESAPANLEEYIEKNPDERANLDSVGEGFAAEGVRTDVSFVDNTMFFDFVMTDVDDAETEEILKPDLEQFLNDQAENYSNVVKQIEEDTGFSDIKMIVIFMDANEEEIISGHYDSTGRVM